MKSTFVSLFSLGHGLLSLVSYGSLLSSTNGQALASESPAKEHAFDKWFSGSPEQAFATAKATKKPVFLYWGAVWCPPCHEIKQQVFTKQRFLELMENVVPVYLDGDTERAQIWGEKLKVSGYPTLLLLDSDGKEIYRFTESVNIQEFEAAFLGTITHAKPFATLVNKLQKEGGPREEWKVAAYANWSDPSIELGLPDEKALALKKDLADKVPAEFTSEKALLSASLLEGAAAFGPKDAKVEIQVLQKQIRDQKKNYLEAIFLSQETAVAARRVLIYSAGDVVKFLAPKSGSTERSELSAQWIQAADKIRNAPEISIDTRLWSIYPEITLSKLKTSVDKSASPQKAQEFPAELVTRVKSAVLLADREATSKYLRHAVISGAADLLAQVKDFEGARALLLKELSQTDTPWYYHSSLAAVEEDAGNYAESLKWADASVVSAKGNSTRLQWMASDASHFVKVAQKLKWRNIEKDLAKRIDQYYSLALTLPDGFTGRNAGRQKKLASTIAKFNSHPAVKGVIVKHQSICPSLTSEVKENCTKHFAEMLKPIAAK
jgi:protein disulfide-isomerase